MSKSGKAARLKHCRTFVTIALLFCAFLRVCAQNIDLKYAEFKDNKLVVHYQLRDSVAGRVFTVRIYSSRDNFLNPLEKVSGDVGLEVKPGSDKIIIWEIQELGARFDGTVSLEVRGRTFV